MASQSTPPSIPNELSGLSLIVHELRAIRTELAEINKTLINLAANQHPRGVAE
jgi:hypothetical protein